MTSEQMMRASTAEKMLLAVIPEIRAEVFEELGREFERRAKNVRNNVTIESGPQFYAEMGRYARDLDKISQSMYHRAEKERAAGQSG